MAFSLLGALASSKLKPGNLKQKDIKKMVIVFEQLFGYVFNDFFIDAWFNYPGHVIDLIGFDLLVFFLLFQRLL